MVWPAYTSLGHGQNFVQKDWVNGISPHGPDEEGIGSTIIIFYHKINVVLLKKKLGSNVDSVGDAGNVITARRIQRWGVPRRGCGAAHKVESALVWCLWKHLRRRISTWEGMCCCSWMGSTWMWFMWEALQKRGVPGRACGGIHEGSSASL